MALWNYSIPISLRVNLFQILDCHFGGEDMEDKPVAVHGFGGGMAVDFFAILVCGKVPEAVEVACPVEHFLVVNLAILRSLFDIFQINRRE